MATPVVATGVYGLAMLAGQNWAKVHHAIWWGTIAIGGALLALSVAIVLVVPVHRAWEGTAE
jgi:hypothetical protein